MRFTYKQIMKMSEGYFPFNLDNIEEVVVHLAQMIVTMAGSLPQRDEELIDMAEDTVSESEDE